MIKKLLIPLLFFVLVGCSNESTSNVTIKNSSTITNTSQDVSSERQDSMKLSDFRKVNIFSLENETSNEFKDLHVENAEAIIFQPLHLKKAESLTLIFKIKLDESDDSLTHINVGVIKDYSQESNKNYDIKSIYSKSINKNELVTVNYTSKDDSTFAICILGTMAGSVGLNGKITKN